MTTEINVPLIVSSWEWGQACNAEAAAVLAGGGSSLDALERGISKVELDPEVRSVGYGSIPNDEGVLQMDAAIMDGATHRAGAVAALEGIANPISVARRVMEKTHHVLLAGEGALRFALREGFETRNLLTTEALRIWEERRRDPNRRDFWRHSDTLTSIILDTGGNLAVGGSTSGLALKLPGRASDVACIGSGIFVDNRVGAAAATGNGDEIMKYCTSVKIVEQMRAGVHPQQGCINVLNWILEIDASLHDANICVFAISKAGQYGAASIKIGDFRYAVWSPGVNELRVAESVY
jgi:N4-(beta-N-acetylglucosaminyl)-L-asparaginase